jgi:hypothetical protein
MQSVWCVSTKVSVNQLSPLKIVRMDIINVERSISALTLL